MQNWTTDEFMKHLARAEWILGTLRGIQLQQEDEGGQQGEEMDEKQIAQKLVKQGIDPMFELYNPNRDDSLEPDIQGIDWRGTL